MTAIYYYFLGTRRYERAKRRYKEESGLICTQCLHNLGPHFEHGPCPECGVPLDREQVQHDWGWIYEHKLGTLDLLREFLPRRVFTLLLLPLIIMVSAQLMLGIGGLCVLSAARLWTFSQSRHAAENQLWLATACGAIGGLLFLLSLARRRLTKARFESEHWRRCWRCVRPIDDGPRGVCAHCNEPWEYEMLKYAWRTRFKHLADEEKPKA